MQARSVHTRVLDPYRAGAELAEGLASIEPEVVFLFSTIHYEGSPELSEAIYDALGPGLILIGVTGDGVYERERVPIGAAALGINSGGTIHWALSSADEAGDDTGRATGRCLDELRAKLGEDPALIFLVADFRLDATELLDVLRDRVAAPVVGGYGGDNHYLHERCFTYANSRVLREGIAMLGVAGDLVLDIRLAQPFRPVGEVGTITDGEETTIRTIDGIPAMKFIERATGMPVLNADRGLITFDIRDPEEPGVHHIRSILLLSDSDEGHVALFGTIQQGQQVQVCLASPDQVVQQVVEVNSSLAELDFTAKVGLIMSCTGRKQLLGNRIDPEVHTIVDAGPPGLSLAGFSSFGEFGPARLERGYSSPRFHNMAYVLLLLGERQG